MVTLGTTSGTGSETGVEGEGVEGEEGAELYDMLFDEQTTGVRENELDPASSALEPLEYGELVELEREDSGVVSIDALEKGSAQRAKSLAAKQAIAAEHQRVQGADHYAVLLIERDADADDIEAAHELKLAMRNPLRKEQASADQMDEVVRKRMKHVEEGSSQWEIEYQRMREEVLRRRS